MAYIVYIIGFFALFIDNTTRFDFNLIFYFWGAQIFRLILENRKYTIINTQKLIFFVTLLYLFIIPSIGVFYLLSLDVTDTAFLTVMFMDIFSKYSKKKFINIQNKDIQPLKWSTIFIYITFIFWATTLPFFVIDSNDFKSLFIFLVPIVLSNIYLEKILKQLKSNFYSILMIILQLTCVTIYLFFNWSGYGRVVLAFYFLTPVLLFCIIKKKHYNYIYIILSTPIIFYILQYSRYGVQISIEDLFVGSAGHHLELTHKIKENYSSAININFKDFFDQYILFFFSWFPREFWPTKPIQINFYSVNLIFEPNKYPIGYSQSLGFVGEKIFLLNNYYLFGLILDLVLFVLVRKFILKFSYGYFTPVMIFDLNLITYFWGGVGIFGSRFFFFIFPVFVFLFLRFIFASILYTKNKLNFY